MHRPSAFSKLDLVTTFKNDIATEFGKDKCACIKIEKKKKNTTKSPIEINGLIIKPIQGGKSYRYLGQDINVAYVGTFNKQRVSSELSAFNKKIAHNTFATPVITQTIGILEWTS